MQCIVTYATDQHSELSLKYSILDTYHTDTVYLCEQGCEERSYFSKPEGGREQTCFGNTGLDEYIAYKKYGAISRNGSVVISVKK
jgi:hypothetical protein